MKTCKICNTCKPFTEFFRNNEREKYRSESTMYQTTCKACRKIATAKHYLENPNYYKNKSLKKLYGMSNDDFVKLKAAQNGVCACCKKPETRINRRNPKNPISELAVDHCHTTGKIRGLLCSKCNFAIGLVDDNTEILKNLIEYLNAK